MEVYVVRDSDFTLQGSNPASYLLHYDAYAKRFLTAFRRTTLVGRLFNRQDATARPATGPGVDFAGLPGYHGPRGLIGSLPALLGLLRRTINRDAAYILRVPATIPTLYSIVLWALRIPFAVEVAADPHDGYSKEALGNSRLAPFFRALFVRATRWQCRNAIATAYVTREALQRRYPPAAAASTFSFTSIDLQDEAYVGAARSWPTPLPKPLHLVMIGNMQKTLKGHDTLIEALVTLRRKGHDLRVTMIGFGENLETFRDMATKAGVAEHVTFTGKLQNGAPVRAVLDTGDIFILPSRQEGLPRALLEAMARALPAVASRVGGTPELLDEAFLFEAGDVDGLVQRIESLLDREALAAASARNLEVARTYHARIITARRDAFFDYVARHSGRRIKPK